ATLPQALAIGALLVLQARALLRIEPSRLASARSGGRTWALGRWRAPAGIAALLAVLAAIALPVYGLIWRAGRVSAAPALGRVWTFDGLVGSLRRAWVDLVDPQSPWSRTVLTQTLLWASVGAAL